MDNLNEILLEYQDLNRRRLTSVRKLDKEDRMRFNELKKIIKIYNLSNKYLEQEENNKKLFTNYLMEEDDEDM